MPNTERYWSDKLPAPFELKKLKTVDWWWVDGYCGYYVTEGASPREAVQNALKSIRAGRRLATTGGILCQ